MLSLGSEAGNALCGSVWLTYSGRLSSYGVAPHG